MNLSNCIADVWFRLGFQSSTEASAAGAWVTTAELNRFADDAVKLLGRKTALFLTFDSSIVFGAGVATYAQPALWAFTESAWILFGQQLRITPVAILFALDQAYSATTGPPTRVSFDAAGAGYAVLYPTPTTSGTLGQIMQTLPADSATTLPVSLVVQDYFTNAMLGRARAKESDNAMPEVAAHLEERGKMYEMIFQKYWGAGRA